MGNFVYVSLLKQQENSDFEFVSVSFSAVMVGYIRYQHTVSLKTDIYVTYKTPQCTEG